MYQSAFRSRSRDDSADVGGPLSPDLFESLRIAFGDVRIGNRGERASIKPNYAATGRSIESHGEIYKFNCPFCGDKRRRGWASHLFGQPDPVTGRPMLNLVGCWNDERCFGEHGRRDDFWLMLVGLLPSRRGFRAVDPETGVSVVRSRAELPGLTVGLRLLSTDHPARKYVRDRGFDPDQLDDGYGVGVCRDAAGDLFAAVGRLIIPVNDVRGGLVGWQARKITAGGRFKYFTMPGFPIGSHLYNFDRASAGRCVVLTEGVTHVWSLGRRAVATFGKGLRHAQRELLLGLATLEPLIVLFRDHGDDELAVAERTRESLLAAFPGRVLIATPPLEPAAGDLRRPVAGAGAVDAGDLTTAAAWRAIRDAAVAAGVAVADFGLDAGDE